MAHPFTVDNPETMIAELSGVGLVGIEVYYNGYTSAEVGELVSMADKYSLIATGGSDYHGLAGSTETQMGGVNVPTKSAERLIATAEQRGLKLAFKVLSAIIK